MQKTARAVLNEYCQKNELNTPHYAARILAEPPNSRWEARVRVNGKEVLSSGVHAQKRSACESAAENFLSTLIGSHQSICVNPNKIYGEIHLIDLENRHFLETKNEDCLYIGFIGSVHSSLKKYSDWEELKTPDLWNKIPDGCNHLIYKAEGGVKELVDHFLTAFTVYIIDYICNSLLPTTVCIVSSDNSSWCTRLCLLQHARWKGVEDLLVVKNIC
jgi:hypothetical protein